MDDLISRKALLAEYDRVHIGIPGRARKLIENAPKVDAAELPIWATERAYKNGYEQGKKDALKKIPVTNADRIRAMSDEELARYMAELIDNIDSQTCCYSNIPDEWLSWLQQPAEVE